MSDIVSPGALEAIGLEHHFGTKSVLRGLSFTVKPGQIYSLLGGNGAGKSTTLSVFLGLVRPTAGQALVCGHDVAAAPRAARSRLAYVPENVALYEHLSARENIDYFLAIAGSEQRSPANIDESLAAVGLAREAWAKRVGGFSKGMRQKVARADPAGARAGQRHPSTRGFATSTTPVCSRSGRSRRPISSSDPATNPDPPVPPFRSRRCSDCWCW
ncbi:ATP-binding cassette domain-containing protein [Corallococcus exiguus]|uniref:ATP-binding cassette domain-containing protein n=1 Tax=Corallococcus exiguus TaxID=83462 RepID=UPI001F5EC01E|nr:ABC transporter ATP-binding protein [Corallococcus exiguus]